MDTIDARILQILIRDGRISNLALAGRIGLSPSACLRRVQDLERRGVIRGYRAVIDPVAVGAGLTAYMSVGLADHSKAGLDRFERAMDRAPQVRECHNVTGTTDYLLRVEVSDIAAFKVFHTDVLGTVPGVTEIVTYVVVDTSKDERA